jgi:hypothetical protein
MKKYKASDIYILDVSQVKKYSFPNWYERITESTLLPYKYAAVKKYDKYCGHTYYQVNGNGEKVFCCSSDTKEIGDLFVRAKTPLSMTDAMKQLPKKVSQRWLAELNDVFRTKGKEDVKQPGTIPIVLLDRVIQTIEEYMAEPMERLCPGGRAIKKNFSLGQVDAYESCLKLLRELRDDAEK